MAATTLEPRPDDAGDDETTAPTSFEVMPVRFRDGASSARVGRAEECDIVINDQSVSSLHAVFERSSTGALTVKDSGSKNGTFVDERFVGGKGAEAQNLGGRHALRFGSLSAIFLDLDGLVEEGTITAEQADAVVEALASGIPVLAHPTPGLCESLGGRVIQPPFTLGPVREALLADPTLLVHERALHDGDLAGGAAEGLQRDEEPGSHGLAEGHHVLRLGRRSRAIRRPVAGRASCR